MEPSSCSDAKQDDYVQNTVYFFVTETSHFLEMTYTWNQSFSVTET
jgi:hypothetical protein